MDKNYSLRIVPPGGCMAQCNGNNPGKYEVICCNKPIKQIKAHALQGV